LVIIENKEFKFKSTPKWIICNCTKSWNVSRCSSYSYNWH